MSAQSRETAGRRIHGLDAGEREAQRRAAILDAALTVFAKQGYANTSVEQVCAAANVSTKSFYRIYDNREDLYSAVYAGFRELAFTRMAAAIEQATTETPLQREDRLLNALVDCYFADQRYALVIQGPDRAVTPAVERLRRESRQRAAGFLRETWRQRWGIEPAESLAIAVMGGIFDLFAMAIVDGEPLSGEQLVELRQSVKAFYAAVRAGAQSVR
ncbi:MAG: TetR/AcrR family transcriptional regulator [Nocardioidaceae bacterium]